MKTIYLLATLLLFWGISCSSPSDISDSSAPALVFAEPPVVTGIILRDATGTARGYWGIPSVPGDETGNEGVFIAPNPFNSHTSIGFSVVKDSRVKILIVRARLAGTQENTSVGGAVVSVSKDIIVAEFDRGIMAEGSHMFYWNASDKKGNSLPAGFYRVYVIKDNEILWNDLYLSRVPGDMPPGMRFR